MKAILGLVVLALTGMAAYLAFQHWSGSGAQSPSTAPTQEPKISTTPEVRYPVAAPTADPSAQSDSAPHVPALDHSDQTLEGALIGLWGSKLVSSLFNLNEVVRRIVVTIDTATGNSQPTDEFSFLKPLDTEFLVATKGGQESIAPANFRRYSGYMELARNLDTTKLVSLYVRFYPLFQAAYAELGTKKYFNDRVIEVIDSALQAPEPNGPIEVTRPSDKYRFKFANERLEELPVSQKVLLRMGPENARAVKAKLRELRQRLIALN